MTSKGSSASGIEPESLSQGTVVAGKYRLSRMLGRGGFGVVFAAEVNGGGYAALKILSRTVLEQTGGMARFHREADLARRLSHPNIVRVLDAGADERGLLYIAFELLEGRSIEDAIIRDGAFAPRRAAEITIAVLDALEEAHRLGVIHRDIKPANLYLVRDGARPEDERVKVLDFGIAKSINANTHAGLTRAGTTMGTPIFMSPEQVLGETVGPPTDLFALGIVLGEMVLGASPYGSEPSALEIMTDRITGKAIPFPADLMVGALGPVLTRATASDISHRFSSATEMRYALTEILGALSPYPPSRRGVESALAGAATQAAPGLADAATDFAQAPLRPSSSASEVGPTAAVDPSQLFGRSSAAAPGVSATVGGSPLEGRGASWRSPSASDPAWVQRPLPHFSSYPMPEAQASRKRAGVVALAIVVALLGVAAVVAVVIVLVWTPAKSDSKKTSIKPRGTSGVASLPSESATTAPALPRKSASSHIACPKADSVTVKSLIAEVLALGLPLKAMGENCPGSADDHGCIGASGYDILTTSQGAKGKVSLFSFSTKRDLDAYVTSVSSSDEGDRLYLIGQKQLVVADVKAPMPEQLSNRICH